MLIVTIAALVMAASLGWFAYRLMQEDQRRSEARVALLTAALADDDTPVAFEPPARSAQVGFIAPAPAPSSTSIASAMRAEAPAAPGIVYLDNDSSALRSFHREQTATPIQARSTTSAGIETEPVQVADVVAAGGDAQDSPADAGVATRAAGLFADVPEARPADARGLIALAGLVVVGTLVLAYVWFGRPAPAASASVASGAAVPTSVTPSQGGIPLELLSLSHEQRNGVLVVRGLVRNPVSASDRTGLVASVMLLDQAGGFLGSGRTPLENTRLRPGDDVGFSVELPSHKEVRRYRVTFRGVDGALVPHADKRAR
jgi:hypothetical protein